MLFSHLHTMDMQELLNQLESCMQNLRGIPYIKVNKKSNFIANAKKATASFYLCMQSMLNYLCFFFFFFV